MDFTSPAAWAFWILTTVAAYVGAYAAAKGKQRAAKEDSDQIRLELARNTQAVKEVEARVNSGLWLIFYTMSAEVVHSRLVAVLKTA